MCRKEDEKTLSSRRGRVGLQNVKPAREGELKKALFRDWRLYVMLILPVAFYIIFCYKPMTGIIMAFQENRITLKPGESRAWNGLANFEFIMRANGDFWPSLWNTLWLNFLGLIAGFPIPIVLAIMLNEIRSAGIKRVSQTLLYLPHFLSWIIIGGMVLQIFSPTSGVINSLLLNMGWIKQNIPFLTEPTHWTVLYTVVGVWQSMGWGTILYLSAITGINMELFEAAKIDGANKWQQIWHVTLPGIRSTIVVLLILNVGQMMNIGFDKPYVLRNPKVLDYAQVLSTYVRDVSFPSAGAGNFARATAIGLFQSVVGLIMITSANFITKRIGEEGIW